MTKIEYDSKKNQFKIVADGHSGYAIPGQDIVCSGISTLLQTLIIHTKNTPNTKVQYQVADGHLSVHVTGNNACAFGEFVVTGLRAIESQYGEYISVKKGDLF